MCGFTGAMSATSGNPVGGTALIVVAAAVFLVGQQVLMMRRAGWLGGLIAAGAGVLWLLLSLSLEGSAAGWVDLESVLVFLIPLAFVMITLARHRARFSTERSDSLQVRAPAKGSLITGAVGFPFALLGLAANIMGVGADAAAIIMGATAVLLGSTSVRLTPEKTRARTQAWWGISLGALAIAIGILALVWIDVYCGSHDCTM